MLNEKKNGSFFFCRHFADFCGREGSAWRGRSVWGRRGWEAGRSRRRAESISGAAPSSWLDLAPFRRSLLLGPSTPSDAACWWRGCEDGRYTRSVSSYSISYSPFPPSSCPLTKLSPRIQNIVLSFNVYLIFYYFLRSIIYSLYFWLLFVDTNA